MINGVTQIALTKSDIMDHFEEITIADQYIVDGKSTQELPYDLCDESYKVHYKTFKGWNTDLGAIKKNGESLPSEFETYVSYLESALGVKIPMISIGPGRDELISR